MERLNVTKTRELDLCVSCEICSAVCPVNAITMENRFGQFLPKIDDEKCTECGLCLELCPGIDLDPLKLRHKKITNDVFDGPYIESHTAYSNNSRIRKKSTSDGLITNLITELIKKEEFYAAFVLGFDKFEGKPARLKATNRINEILKAAKSKYIPASVYNVIKTLKKKDDKKYIIVGTSCQIDGTKKFIKKFNIPGENLLFLGLFCDKTLNFNIIRYLEDTYGKSNEKLIKFEFRTKEKHGWPGNTNLYFDSGRELIVDRIVRMQLKRFFQLNRCLFCLDKLNGVADISFGDCYIEGKGSFDGKSSVVIRTHKGRKIFDKYSYLFTLEKENIGKIRESQSLMDKKNNLEYTKIFIKKHSLYPNTIPDYKIDRHSSTRLLKSQKYIKWGENYNINKIKFNLFLSRIESKLRITVKVTIAVSALGITIVKDTFIHGWSKGKHVSKTKKSATGNIVIVGGQLFNKGAQAMTFTVVDQMKRRFPGKNIYLFSTQDFNRGDEERNIYNFNILPYDLVTKIRLLNSLGRLLKNSKYELLEDHIKEVIKNADFFIDISGYALSSQWSWFSSINYLLNIIIAKKYFSPYYIFPQSMGPFDYPQHHKIFLYPLMKLYLKYPERIFLREEEGLMCVRKFTKINVEKSYDIVLQNKGYHLTNIYKKKFHFKNIKIESNSVGVIPNLRVIKMTNPDEIYSVYKILINRLINAKKTVYVLRHSYEDLEICERIKDLFPDNESVRLISDDLNAVELGNIIKQFDFVIASRYHSIIHAYRNGVPAIVVSWATKYFELLESFDQVNYFFDCRNDIDIEEINGKLDGMIRNYNYERKRIANNLIDISNKGNIFDAIFALP